MHVAHNAVVGRNCLVAAQSGIAGSASLGDRVLVGGQVGMFVHGLHVRACACSACACMCMHCICIPGMTCGQLSPQCYMWQRNKQWCPPPADPRPARCHPAAALMHAMCMSVHMYWCVWTHTHTHTHIHTHTHRYRTIRYDW